MKKIYLDHAAATPVDPEVVRAMEPYWNWKFGNPGSLHSFGQEAIAAVDAARETVARAIGADFRQVVFAASATEANNLALRGAVAKFRAAGIPRIIISAVEHESVVETARDLERVGAELVVIPVDRRGSVDVGRIEESLTADTALVSVIWGQNEIGTIEPIARIAEAVKKFRGDRAHPLLHTDAAQAFQFIDCGVKELGVDLATVSSQKIYGPKGAAALFVRDAASLAPGTTGGEQEFGLRSGTENVPAIAGFAKAVELAVAVRDREAGRLAVLRARLWEGIKIAAPDAEVNGIEPGRDDGSALPSILNVWFPGRSADGLLTKLDMGGLAASAGSACSARAAAPSYAVKALGGENADRRARESVRFSLGRPTTADDIDAAIAVIGASV